MKRGREKGVKRERRERGVEIKRWREGRKEGKVGERRGEKAEEIHCYLFMSQGSR